MAVERQEIVDARTPLLRPHSIAAANKRGLFTAHNVALAAGPLATLAIVLTFGSFPESGDDKVESQDGAHAGRPGVDGVLVDAGAHPHRHHRPAASSALPFFIKIMDSDAVSAQ